MRGFRFLLVAALLGGAAVVSAQIGGGGGVVGSGNSTPGGSDTQVQFNDAGVFGGDAGLTYDSANDVLSVDEAYALVDTSAGSGNRYFRFEINDSNGNAASFRRYSDDGTTPQAAIWTYSSSQLLSMEVQSRLSVSPTLVGSSGDLGFGRNGAGVFEVNNGTAGTYRDAKLRMLRVGQATPPTCSASCGTSPSVSGSDTAMIVTMGASGVPASPFTVTFDGTWAATPSCTANASKTGMVAGKAPILVVASTTTVIITTNGTAPATSDTYAIHCIGVS